MNEFCIRGTIESIRQEDNFSVLTIKDTKNELYNVYLYELGEIIKNSKKPLKIEIKGEIRSAGKGKKILFFGNEVKKC